MPHLKNVRLLASKLAQGLARTDEKAYEYPGLRFAQVAKLLHCSEATLFRMLAKGDVPPSYKIGKRRRWKESDVIAWVEDQLDDGTRGPKTRELG